MVQKIFSKDMLMDDLFSGCDSLTQTLDAKNNVILLSSSEVGYQKWTSIKKVLVMILAKHSQFETRANRLDDSFGLKLLGVLWKPNPEIKSPSKTLFSRKLQQRNGMGYQKHIACDPMGWLATVSF